jgi:hypothetical protein
MTNLKPPKGGEAGDFARELSSGGADESSRIPATTRRGGHDGGSRIRRR